LEESRSFYYRGSLAAGAREREGQVPFDRCGFVMLAEILAQNHAEIGALIPAAGTFAGWITTTVGLGSAAAGTAVAAGRGEIPFGGDCVLLGSGLHSFAVLPLEYGATLLLMTTGMLLAL
jgi:hypothetical protein